MDPRTGQTAAELDAETTSADLERITAAAAAATRELAELSRSGRAEMLRSMGRSLERHRDDLVAIADRETGLGPVRLGGELTRTRWQLDLFADVLEDGGYLEATIDHAGDTPMGPRPDLRRMLTPLGPVAVFGASNFPFAFSVPGGDTASALAAGCPVVAKVHDAHPLTSVRSQEALAEGARAAGVESDVVSVIYGRRAAGDLVRHPSIRAVGFTGSLSVGRELFDVAGARPTPIPFYGELGALNPVMVCREAARSRGESIGQGLAASFTLGVGQFCTKPGVALIPASSDGDALRDALVGAVEQLPAGVMLSERTRNAFAGGSVALREHPGVQVLAEGGGGKERGWWGTPLLLRADARGLDGPVLDECFGPVLVLVEYGSDDDLLALLARFGPALTGTVHADDADRPVAARILRMLQDSVGRVVWNGYPTGVAVSWAMHHGGPYPATTNPLHTSVGATSIRRWLRPISFQDVPDALLPDELRDRPTGGQLPRRVDGRLLLAD
ncbi:aldehyde dehydrogenase (NADP(+)) [Nakamurella panacisegetis]|uniref:aldehyde dehydrogenase (NADP(+)) n=1 Tax=Nakamurella panacisegetis TaxID=1090615 RepID=UPI0018D28F5C|nr:aldehyde dehydrogenase (NADP(+)) [Nakamurella panacisegetis]